MLLFAYGAVIPLLLAMAGAALLAGRPDIARVDLGVVAISAFGWWRIRTTGRLALWGLVLLACGMVAGGYLTVISGGATSATVIWLFLLPPMAGLLFGIRGATWMSAVLGVGLVALLVAHARSGHWRSLEALERDTLLAAVSHLLVLGMLLVLTRVIGRVVAHTYTELEDARRSAEQASRVKSSFLANMSHEIRTPMNGILGMAEIGLVSDSEEERREALETIRGCAGALLAIINDILDISKIDAGELAIERIPVDVEALVEEVTASCAATSAAKGLVFEAVLGPDLPARVHTDPVRLRQILTNLVGNALKFTERGSVAIAVDWLEDPDTLRLRVVDTGIGIAPDKFEVIFEEFTQSDISTTRQYGGTGLGLSITRRLVDAMGGRIQVRSALGHGSCFEVVLPTAAVEQPAKQAARALDGMRVAVLAHSDLVGRAVQTALAAVGCKALPSRAFDEADLVVASSTLPAADFDPVRRRLERVGVPLMLLEPFGERAHPERRASAAATVGLPLKRARLREVARELLAAHAAPARVPSSAKPKPAVTPIPPSRATPAAYSADAPAPAPCLDGQAVLLVEDNAVNARVAIALLSRMGAEVTHVWNGADAVEALSKHAYPVTLMDCQMPVLDGYEASRQIRGLPGEAGQTWIIAMTAHAMAGDRERCLAAGMDDYIAKPVRGAELEAVLQRRHDRSAA